MRLELNFIIPLENITEIIVLGKRMSSVAVHKFGLVGEHIQMEQRCSTANNQCYPCSTQCSTQKSVPWFIPYKLYSNSSY